MSAVDWPVTVTNALVVTLMLRAGPAKLAAPAPSAAAIGELRPGRRPAPLILIRAFAALELVVAFSLAIPVARIPAQFLVAGLGLVFAALGAVGMMRDSREPCGCFGGDGEHPLGIVNILLGVVFLGSAGLGLSVRTLHDPSTSAAWSALLAVIAATTWAVVARRDHVASVFRNVRTLRSESA